jgi:O-antigen/teichoic acid export membrane protein
LNTVRRIAKNTLVLLFAQIISIGLGFFYIMYTARYLGAEGFGVLSFALAFTGLFGIFADLGLSTLVTREVSRDKSLASKYVGNVLSIKTILIVFTFSLIAIVINFLGYPEQTIKVVYLIGLSIIFSSFTVMFNSIFQAFEKMEYISISRILNSVLMLVGIMFAIRQGSSMVGFALIYFIVSAIVLVYNLTFCTLKFVKPKIEFDLDFWIRSLKESGPFWLTSIFVIIYFRIDMIMLSLMKDNAAVGFYAAPYKLIDVLGFIPAILMSVMFPLFSRFHLNSEDSLKLAFEQSFKYLFIIAFPIGVGTTLLADKIILLIYGIDYSPSIIALQVLIWASVLSFINWTPATLLNSTQKQRIVMIFTCFGAILNIILNFMLIPSMGYVGAGIATVATEFVVGFLMLLQLKSDYNEQFNKLQGTIVRSLNAGLIMGIFLVLFRSYPLFILIPVAIIIYSTILVISNGFTRDDFYLFKQVTKE